jgi:hypothetical protein
LISFGNEFLLEGFFSASASLRANFDFIEFLRREAVEEKVAWLAIDSASISFALVGSTAFTLGDAGEKIVGGRSFGKPVVVIGCQ